MTNFLNETLTRLDKLNQEFNLIIKENSIIKENLLLIKQRLNSFS